MTELYRPLAEGKTTPESGDLLLARLGLADLALGDDEIAAVAALVGCAGSANSKTIEAAAKVLSSQPVYDLISTQAIADLPTQDCHRPRDLLFGSYLAIHQLLAKLHSVARLDFDASSVICGALAVRTIASHSPLKSLPYDGAHHELVKAWEAAPASIDRHSFGLYFHQVQQLKSIQSLLMKVPANQRKESRFVSNLAWENDGLFESVRQLQKYGIKEAYVADNSQLPLVDWHIFNYRGIMNRLPSTNPANSGSQALACLSGFRNPLEGQPAKIELTERQLSSSDQLYKPGDDHKSLTLDYRGIVAGHPDQSWADIYLDIMPDGQLYSLEGLPLAWLASGLGLEVQYEMIRARALSLYADMVIPAYIVDDSDEIKAAEAVVSQANRAKTSNFVDLVVARRRLIARHSDLPALIAKDEKIASQRVRRHGVVGFIRRLPAGHRASQQQRDLCWRDQGIELAPTGETYVREHIRGGDKPVPSSDEVVGHRARLRYVGGSILGVDQSGA